MEKMQKESFIFYRSYAEALENLSDKDKLFLLEAIIKKSLDNEDIELKGIQKNLFALIKPQIEANNKRYMDGMKGGRPKKTNGYEKEKTNGFENNENKKPVVFKNEDEKKTETKPNVNVNVNVNENVNEKEKNKKEIFSSKTILNSLEKLKYWWKWWDNNDDEEMDNWIKEKNVSTAVLTKNYESLVNYCESKGKTYKNYKSALKNFILLDINGKWSQK